MRLSVSIIIILLLLLLTSCGTMNQQSLNGSAETHTYSLKSKTYTNTDRNNNIVYKYPAIKEKGFKKANHLIENYIHNLFTEMYGPDYSDLDLEMNYSISFQNDSFISILFKGWGNVKTAAHPHDWFLTLNINLKNGTKVNLADFYNINDQFKNIYYAAAKKQVPERFLENKDEWIRIIEEMEKNVELTDSNFKQADTYDGVQSYFTPNGLGLSTPVVFAIGDHFETVIPYGDIEPYLKPDKPFELPNVVR